MKKKYWVVVYVSEVDDHADEMEQTGPIDGGICGSYEVAEATLNNWLSDDCETDAKCYHIVEMELTDDEVFQLQTHDYDGWF